MRRNIYKSRIELEDADTQTIQYLGWDDLRLIFDPQVADDERMIQTVRVCRRLLKRAMDGNARDRDKISSFSELVGTIRRRLCQAEPRGDLGA